MKNGCSVCGNDDAQVFFALRGMPVFCNVLLPDKAAASNTPCADIELALCRACGMIQNRVFDSSLVEYAPDYENALHFSGHFQKYAQQTAQGLIDRYGLHQKRITEIGCGDGHFLDLICRMGDNRGVGYDPSMAGKPPIEGADDRISIVPELFTSDCTNEPADLLCCRHALEHIEQPLSFLQGIREALGDRQTVVFFEVPNGQWLLRDLSFWDVIYEHCSYFAPTSLSHLFRKTGFDPINVSECYGDQFLTIEAKPVVSATDPGTDDANNIQALTQYAARFSQAFDEKMTHWRSQLASLKDRGNRVVVWGAGSKGVTFLNALGLDGAIIEHIVDLNPRKHGRFVPGSAQQVIPPESLKANPPDTVIVMNSLYVEEIRTLLRDLGLTAQLMTP